MGVTQTTRQPRRAAEQSEQAEQATQLIALTLNRQTKRYFRLADNKMYEAGVVYNFEAAKAMEVQQDTDDRGFPMFVPYRAKEAAAPVAPTAATAPRVEKVDAPLAPESVSAKGIELGDEDDEVARRLREIDAQGGTEGAVSV